MNDVERMKDLYKAFVRCRPIHEVELIVQKEQRTGAEDTSGAVSRCGRHLCEDT